ncbi:peptide/nickel transport system substrate-binding protein [Pseudochelatococcus lubricantis]|uniref:Peptide/nickel transport system substrate-binding protein n=1 Tax=Pseudochelatococcus lubricantis TaxID=1538102 RepID=A0ABX0UUX1_9HYPH|nr:extracellular solute-binding protein [Pseudochelatococcus lubricantis]NIJ56562.1 peptide/nickel transport system substrate-binding protein [Pseudochelatococcus lubricantis]
MSGSSVPMMSLASFAVPAARACRGALAALLVVGLCALPAPAGQEDWQSLPRREALAMHGEPRLPAGFASLPYVNPDAPKGGRLIQSIIGTFDNLNPFVPKGIAAQGITTLVFQPLMARSADEPFSVYGLIANAVRMPEDRSFVVFHLDPRARFSDGHPVTAADVLFSFELLREKGQLYYRSYLGQVERAQALDPLTVRFDLKPGNRETPLTLAQLPVLPAHLIDRDTFEQTTFQTPVGSGPYVVAAVDAGRSITFRRNPDFWAKDLPATRGLYNFDEIRFDYYRDVNTQFEAFKAGLYDVRVETSASRWAIGYDFPAVHSGAVLRETLPVGTPRPMYGFALNSRRPPLADVRVREALGYFLDFPWVNRNLFYDLYRRTGSYFAGSSLSSAGRPASAGERALLAPFPGAVRADILEGTWRPPEADGSGRDRAMARKGLDLLESAGFALRDGVLRHDGGAPLVFEIMVVSRDQERLALNFAQSLKPAGIVADVRLVDEAQYWKRLLAADFDVILYTWNVSASPGSEQSNRWSSAAADRPGSLNITGAKSPAVDATIDALLAARTMEQFTDATRAFDRALLSGFYVVPLFHADGQWVARRAEIDRPEKVPLFGPVIDSWWRKP